MKNHEEMTERVFRRIHEYECEKQRRSRLLRRIFLTASPVCVALLVGAGFLLNGLHRPPKPLTESIISTESSTEAVTESIKTTETVSFSAVSTVTQREKSAQVTETVPVSETETAQETAPLKKTVRAELKSEYAEAKKAPHDSTTAAVPETTIKTTQTSPVTAPVTEQTQPVSYNGENPPNGIADLLYSVTLDGKNYIQFAGFNGKTDLFTPDEFIGYGRDFGGLAVYFDNTELYTAKESKYVLIARYETGTEIILGRVNNIIINGREYFTTQWDTDPYTADESNFLGTVSDFEKIDIPYADQLRRENGEENTVLEPECRLYAVDSETILAIHSNGNKLILCADT